MTCKVKDSGVSPVIGTILLVAITIVLIAIITAVVMGIPGSSTTYKEVGMVVTPYAEKKVPSGYIDVAARDTHGVNIVFYGGKDFDDLMNVRVTIDGKPTFNGKWSYSTIRNYSLSGQINVGTIYKFRAATSAINNNPAQGDNRLTDLDNIHTIVIGTFSDGTEQVLYDSKKDMPAMGTSTK